MRQAKILRKIPAGEAALRTRGRAVTNNKQSSPGPIKDKAKGI